MKERLLEVLRLKLKEIGDNTVRLNELNQRLKTENDDLDSIKEIIELFKDSDGNYDINNFERLERSSFDKIMIQLGGEVLSMFSTESCNYEGLTYIISGINKGISLTLTDEQTEAIQLLIDSLNNKRTAYDEIINEIKLQIGQLKINDIDTLIELNNKYNIIIDKLDRQEYISEIEEVIEAINYNNLNSLEGIEIFSFLLKYNADIYLRTRDYVSHDKHKENDEHINKNDKNKYERENEDFHLPRFNRIEDKNETIEKKNESKNEEEKKIDEVPKAEETEPVEKDDVDTKEIDINPQEESSIDSQPEIEPGDIHVTESTINNLNNDEDGEYQEYNPFVISSNLLDKPSEETENTNENIVDNDSKEEVKDIIIPPLNQSSSIETNELSDLPVADDMDGLADLPVDEDMADLSDLPVDEDIEKSDNIENDPIYDKKEQKIDDDHGELTKEVATIEIESDEDNNLTNDVTISDLLDEYGIKYRDFTEDDKSDLLTGDINNYRDVLSLLKENNIIMIFAKNSILMKNLLLHSNREVIEKTLDIIEKDLSVDEEDKKVTVNMIIMTMPTIFISEPAGTFDNFVNNIATLKEWNINLIDLFDFSREVLIVNHDILMNNYGIVQKYELKVDSKNAKYLLVLPNIEERLDYYVETVAKDNTKNGNGATFDGIDYIKLYPDKLNTVNDVTIKRLKYASENGKKIFGSKEKSLSGEITNLKVDILNMPDEYLGNYFNNEFTEITREELSNYIDIIHNAETSDYTVSDNLNGLEKYHNGLRYNFEGINISYNKVLRIYNVLIKNSIAKDKALIFALCYNSVITKEEYNKIKGILSSLGGL